MTGHSSPRNRVTGRGHNVGVSAVVCPVCHIPLDDRSAKCPDCGEDLTALVYLARRADILYNEVLGAAQAGQVDDAVRILEESLRIQRGAAALVLLGKLYARKGLRAQARSAWAEALQIHPGDAAAESGLAYLSRLESEEAAAATEAAGRAESQQTLVRQRVGETGTSRSPLRSWWELRRWWFYSESPRTK